MKVINIGFPHHFGYTLEGITPLTNVTLIFIPTNAVELELSTNIFYTESNQVQQWEQKIPTGERKMPFDLPLTMNNNSTGIATSNDWLNHASTHAANDDFEQTLYQHLDIEVLIKTFTQWLYRSFSVNRLDFCLPELEIEMDLSIQISNKQELSNRIQYDLNYQSRSLGKLELFRNREFSVFEKISIDNFVKNLYGPLYNAVRYADACRSGYRDALTGLYNRAALEAFLFDGTTTRNEVVSAVLICDTDQFKWINDHYGHTVGDEILKTFSNQLGSVVREDGRIFRYGGDEFVVALDSTSAKKSRLLAEQIRIETEDFSYTNGTSLTTTIGATAVRDGECLREAFRRADSALLIGKGTGRNKVMWHKRD